MAIRLLTAAVLCALPLALDASPPDASTLDISIPPTASSICVYNDAAFVLKWHLKNTHTGVSSAESKSYPVWQTKCMSAAAIGNLTDGDALVPVVKAVWGKEVTVPASVLYDPANATQITYICKGTTLDFSCSQGPPPATAGNVTAAVLQFLEGFILGLGTEIGFSDCLSDINATFHDVTAIVDFLEDGINHRTAAAVAKAFELLGDLLKDISAAIKACVKDAEAFAAKMKALAAALSGNVGSVIKVVVDELVHIYHERHELTADCKTVVTSWRGADYKDSGKAVGDIVGIIVEGL